MTAVVCSKSPAAHVVGGAALHVDGQMQVQLAVNAFLEVRDRSLASGLQACPNTSSTVTASEGNSLFWQRHADAD